MTTAIDARTHPLITPKHSLKLSFMESGHTMHPGRTISRDLSFKPIRFPANITLIEHPKEGLHLFDTGYSENFRDHTRKIPEAIYRWITPVTIDAQYTAAARIKAAGYRLSDIRKVILSHFHADHIGGACDFPDSEFLGDLVSLKQLHQQNRWMQVKHGYISSFLPKNLNSRSSDYRGLKRVILPINGLEEGYDLFGDQTAFIVPLPGHAYGHIGLLAYSGRWNFLVADAVWSHAAYKNLNIPSKVAQSIFLDSKKYQETIHSLHRLHRSLPEIEIVPCHC